jgi:Effector Associated Constant Component 1
LQISIAVSGSDAAAETAMLRDWLHEGRLKDVESVDQVETPPKLGEQGPELLAILTVVLSAKATLELVRSIHRYIEARRPKIEIEFKTAGKSFKIKAENPPSVSELMAQASKLAQG